MKTYDAMVIFPSTLKDETLEQAVEKVKKDFVRVGAKVLNADVLGSRSFARALKKRSAGIFVRFHFEADPAAITALQERFRINDQIFRVQLTAVEKGLKVGGKKLGSPDASAVLAEVRGDGRS